MPDIVSKVDKTDMQILGRLINNCRESDRQIGRHVGISGNAVSYRIKKMEGAGVITGYTVKIEPPALGYGVFYVVASGTRPKTVEEIGLVGDPFLVVPCVGGITVYGIVAKDDVGGRIKLARSVMRDVRVLSILEAGGGGEDSVVAVGAAGGGEEGGGTGLTRTDLDIVESLLPDSRKRIEDVAAQSGLSTKTVARSIAKLSGSENVQFTTMYDPTALSGYIPYAVLAWISGDVGEVRAVFDRRFGGTYMQVPFTTKNQIVLFMYSDDIFKMDDVTQEIRGVDGVESTDIFVPKSMSFPDEWVRDAIGLAKRSPTLHLEYGRRQLHRRGGGGGGSRNDR